MQNFVKKSKDYIVQFNTSFQAPTALAVFN